MFNIVLVEPEIPPNTGNVIRLAANTGARLHLVEPLGFEMSDKQLRRAGLDYHEYASVKVHADFDALVASEAPPPDRVFALSTLGSKPLGEATFAAGDWFVFGCETRGLAPALRQRIGPERLLRLPMRPGNRSLNLSNAVAVVVYEAWRQLGYAGGG
jgi:tRNA (cytidine/uridine-2'-O-)-methyltransferase